MPTLITKAVEILQKGGLVAFPTETVYGLGADALNETAIHSIFRAKNRPFNHPLIVHIPDLGHIEKWAREISDDAYQLAQEVWPGPLTIILKKQSHVLDLVTGCQDTIGLRIPSHPIALELLQMFGRGIAAPSANQFTHISPTSAKAVDEELNGRVDMILDGGVCDVGLESTIIDMTGPTPTILRPGIITANTIATLLKKQIASTVNSTKRVPGMHHLHYAPTTKTMLIATEELQHAISNLAVNDMPTAVLLYSSRQIQTDKHIQLIPMPLAAEDYAHELYQTLRALDHQQFKQIMIETVPEGETWEAVRDRLFKATASR